MSNETHDSKTAETETRENKSTETDNKECRGCSDCAHSKESKKPCKRLKWKYSMKTWVFALIAIVCVGGLIAPLGAQYWAPIKDAHEVALDVWNSYVSIVLGVVATLLSIVSLVFSFHNEEEENIQQREYNTKFNNITESVMLIEKTVGQISTDVSTTRSTVDKINQKVDRMDDASAKTTTETRSESGDPINQETVQE